jgi:hypothetical protein
MNKIALLAAMMIGVTGAASAMDTPKVEYSADTMMETEQATMKGHVNYAPGKERREMDQRGNKSIMIIRQDKKKMWMLIPEQKMYMENALGSGDKRSQPTDLSQAKVEATEVGSETVNGVDTKKLKVIVTTERGKMGGFFWKTSDGILVKSDLVAMEKGKKMRMKTELSNLKIGHQDPALFEIPAGYAAMDFGGMMGGAMTGRHRR